MGYALKAIDFMLHQEDSTLSGIVTDAKNDHGGETRFGLCARFHQSLLDSGFFDTAKTPCDEALDIATRTYQAEYAVPLRLDDLQSYPLACAILSFAVVDGIGSALAMLRDALSIFGPLPGQTLDDLLKAEQAAPADTLVRALVQHQLAHYEAIVAKDPSQVVWMCGWQNRANQVLALVDAGTVTSAVPAKPSKAATKPKG